MIPAPFESSWREFDRLIRDIRDESGLVTINQTYTMLEGVLRVFRRRLTLAQAIDFANVLPILLLRALFISDWDTSEPPVAFGDRAAMAEEVLTLRPGHNSSTPTAIHDVAFGVRKHLANPAAFDAVLATLPEGAREFWDPENRP